MKNLDADALYLHCEECEWGWGDLDSACSGRGGFLTFEAVFAARAATLGEVREAGWEPWLDR